MEYKHKMFLRKMQHKNKLFELIYRLASGLKTKMSKFMSDEEYVRKLYKENTGKTLDLENPITFNEKLIWYNIYDKNPLYTNLADKYEVRKYVSEKIGDKYLVPLIGLYDSVDDIPFDELPGEYVLKCTHDCGSIVFNTENNPINIRKAKSKLKQALKRNYYEVGRIWCYKNIKPRIICETLIETEDRKPPRDYKIMCFDGEPKFAFVASDRPYATKFDFFDIEWNRIPVRQHYPNSNYSILKPKKWDEMIRCAKALSQGIPHVRVDLYVDAHENIIFGELTFSHFSGTELFEPDRYEELFGAYFKLPVLDKGV